MPDAVATPDVSDDVETCYRGWVRLQAMAQDGNGDTPEARALYGRMDARWRLLASDQRAIVHERINALMEEQRAQGTSDPYEAFFARKRDMR